MNPENAKRVFYWVNSCRDCIRHYIGSNRFGFSRVIQEEVLVVDLAVVWAEDTELAPVATAAVLVVASAVALFLDTAVALVLVVPMVAMDPAWAVPEPALEVTEPALEVPDQVWVATEPQALPVWAAMDLVLGVTDPAVTPVWAELEAVVTLVSVLVQAYRDTEAVAIPVWAAMEPVVTLDWVLDQVWVSGLQPMARVVAASGTPLV